MIILLADGNDRHAEALVAPPNARVQIHCLIVPRQDRAGSAGPQFQEYASASSGATRMQLCLRRSRSIRRRTIQEIPTGHSQATSKWPPKCPGQALSMDPVLAEERHLSISPAATALRRLSVSDWV